jgi:hypothetical protein
MTRPHPAAPSRFDPDCLAGLDEPVRRYFEHALGARGPVAAGVRLTMSGRIDVGRWLDFTAEQEFRGHAFEWRARAGWGRFKPLRVVDAYAGGGGSTEGKIFGRVRFMHAHDANTARAAAGRAAAEAIWVPGALLPGPTVSWRAASHELIVARVHVPPETPEVALRISETGAVRSISLRRWGDVGQKGFGYIPFGGDVHAERRFGDAVLPSRVTVGWWYGTPRYKPFFEATILSAEPLRSTSKPAAEAMSSPQGGLLP